MAPIFRYRTQPVATTPGGMADGSDSVEFGRVPIGPSRSTNNMDPSDNNKIISTTHRDPEPAMAPNDE